MKSSKGPGKEKGSMDHILVIKMLVEEYFRKGRKLHKAFMDLAKSYDKSDKEAVKCY